ncbi:BirA family transcriptional regulator, biotin operon repressor / biotin-[acetyl-CoA-carboxylase] ligase [Ruminococcus sp. YE71]|uniref:biotin--[acetyl-CoA-carboxylase] ligase n=1 Tax=unclassified Ruminococcus TaxID=2608920 RepID=UPI00088412E6|nr:MULTISPECIES: biotin--[acetyl-CoA-carboxylase] ligase [unclassified Ruminococcus]SDA23745.1 BirA family transcriptional regulator, biotin operon repressor / biotin-[acetyl-CoA-carboxylase] ligase [Ruminococcus sp. YE78]SFW40451.1 BirA family transcriptional regulator, biotin operon repressor / biotin-[acetyl-CoA-carboxylase] ligase [Ruminococcus sp. YE71]
MPKEFDAERIRTLAAEMGCGYDIDVICETDSTNNVLKKLAAETDRDGYLLIARRQTAGRGRLGRSFFSPDSGVYMSVLIRPKTPPEQSLFFTTAAAVAVCRAVEKTTDLTAKIKWVNDVYVGDRKVCGILCESAIEHGLTEWTVAGIGVNLAHPKGGFPPEIADRAGALYDGEAPEGFEERFAAALAAELFKLYSDGNFTDVSEYRERSMLIGRELTAVTAQGEYPCRAVGIDDSAALLIELPDGSRGRLCSGEVSIRL